MKFSCTKDNLLKNLSIVSHGTVKSSHLPILQNVLITATGEGIQLTATNLEVGITAKVRGKVDEPGSITVPAQVVLNYISLVTVDRVDIEVQETTLLITAGSQHTKIRGQEATEFPLIPEVEAASEYTIEGNELHTALGQTLIAASHDQSRPELTGVQWTFSGKELILAATDSYRLSERRITLSQEVEGKKSFVVPGSSVSEFLRILSNSEEGSVRCAVSDSQMLIETQDITCTSRLIEVAFPEYDRIIPQSHKTRVTVSRQDMTQAIRAASLFSKTGIFDVSIHCNAEDQSVTIASVNSQIGENVSKINAEIQGESVTIVFNFKYLLEGIAQMGGDVVELQCVDGNAPGMMRPIGGLHDLYFYIIMPIKQ